MERRKPGEPGSSPHHGITGKEFQAHENEKNGSAESYEIVRKHNQISMVNDQWSIPNYQ